MKKEKTVVEGYTIIKREEVGEAMVVLGHNPSSSLTPFVTWKAYEHSDFKSFQHGHYCANAIFEWCYCLLDMEYFSRKLDPEKSNTANDLTSPLENWDD